MEPKMPTSNEITRTDRIRALNDELRQNISSGHGHAVMTAGIAALGAEAVARIIKTIEVYDDFCHANDPYQEHDFGSFEADGHTIIFKIDYYDSTMTQHSPDPADPTVTERIITIMLAEEY
jgi:benzoyl-CoA reductase/2-hydroxyglutaryl-CoA dehydratase subunit BcrC/BadD/HgdB